MTAFLEFVQTWLARALAAWVAGLAGWLAVRFGFDFSSDQQKALVEHLVGIIVPLVLTVYSILHKSLNKRINPGDAASTHLMNSEVREANMLRQ